MDTLVGASIGGYSLIRLLGSGGMGAVYWARAQISFTGAVASS